MNERNFKIVEGEGEYLELKMPSSNLEYIKWDVLYINRYGMEAYSGITREPLLQLDEEGRILERH